MLHKVYEKDNEESIWVYVIYYIVCVCVYYTYKVCEKDNEESIWAIKKIKLDGDDDMRACVLNEIELLVALRDESSIIHMKDYEVRARTHTHTLCACVSVCLSLSVSHILYKHTHSHTHTHRWGRIMCTW